MVDALSHRVAAGLEARRTAEMFVAGMRAASQADVGTEQSSTDKQAVIKTISSDSGETLRVAWLEKQGRGHLAKMSSEEYLARTEAYFDDLSQRMHMSVELKHMERGRATLAENERIYAKMSSSPPMPPKELQGDEREAALKLMDKLGIAKSTFGHDTSVFVNEGARYILHRDGKLEAHDAEIAPSEDEKTKWLEVYARQIGYGKADPTSLHAEFDVLTARIEATKAELFPNLPRSTARAETAVESPAEYSRHITFG
ncbi:MAG: hypothetical protein WBA73_17970 [Devosia sp.]